MNLLSQSLQVRNSGITQPGGFLGGPRVSHAVSCRLARAGTAGEQSSWWAALLSQCQSFSMCFLHMNQCGLPHSMVTWDSLFGNSGPKGECPGRDEQKLRGLFQPSLGVHTVSFPLRFVQEAVTVPARIQKGGRSTDFATYLGEQQDSGKACRTARVAVALLENITCYNVHHRILTSSPMGITVPPVTCSG